MSMLNFKHGLYSGLQNAPLTPGTIYVTTDEKAMYVDLPVGTGGATQRIRLSQMITLNTTQDWRELTPPYSTEAFYYIVEANALLKYVGNSWVQINSTAELESILTNMGFYSAKPASPKHGDIYSAGGKNYVYNSTITDANKWVEIGTVGKEIIDLGADISALSTELGLVSAALDQEKLDRAASDDAITALITSLGGLIGYTGTGATLPSNPKNGDIFIQEAGNTKTVYVYAYNTSTKAYAWTSDLSHISDRIEALKARIEEVALVAGDDSAVSDLNTAVENLNTALSDLQTAITNAKYIKADGTVGMEADLNLGGHKLTNVAAPSAETDGVNKKYVDDAKTAILGEADYQHTVKDAYDEGHSATQWISGHETAFNNLSESVETLTKDSTSLKTFKNVEEALGIINQTIDKLDETYTSDQEFAEAREEIEKDFEDMGKRIDDHLIEFNNLSGAVNAFTDGASELKTFKNVEDALGTINQTINKLDETYTSDEEFEAAREEIEKDFEDIGKRIDEHLIEFNTLSQAVETLEDDLVGKIQAADAMKYMGTVAAESALPTTDVSVGHTYKATQEFTLSAAKSQTGAAVTVYVGDLLIARGTEGDSGVITSAVKWDHVPSGYVADYNPGLDVANPTTNVAEITLTSAHAEADTSGDLGKFKISSAENSAITVNVSADKSVAIGMTWGTF